MKLTAHTVDVHTAEKEFRIARHVESAFQRVIIRLEHDGLVGVGEAAPSEYYGGETIPTVFDAVAVAADLLGDDPFQIEAITARLRDALSDRPATCAAVDIALHDLMGKRFGAPLWQVFGLDAAKAPLTSFTIAISEPDEMARQAAAAAERGFRVLKIKVGTDRDDERLQAIRGATDLPLRLDANTGWTAEQTVEHMARWADLGIEFVEQPVPRGDNEALRWIRERADLPIMADESCIDLADLPGLVGCVDAINIKLMKCRGLRKPCG